MEYKEYEQYINTIVKDNSLGNFKSNPIYNYILEHVSADFGAQYLEFIKKKFDISDTMISFFGKMNDCQGEPHKIQYHTNLIISPTSLRYIFHAALILSYMKELGLKTVKIVEVGCGYGGLSLALYFFSNHFGITIENYTNIDLDAPLLLQKKYLSYYNLNMPIQFVKAETFGEEIKGNDNFFISNYCFSEISSEFQKQYIETLFPKCNHGFITWNHIDVYDFGKSTHVENEYPLTGSKNKYVRF